MSTQAVRAPGEGSQARLAALLPAELRQRATDQVGLAVGQAASGAGNLVFTVVAARLLAPRSFAQLASFLALYLVLQLPSASLTALGSVAGEATSRLERRLFLAGLGTMAVLVAAAGPIGSALLIPAPLIVVLGLAAPGAPPLALARGRMYSDRRHLRLVTSLLVEPVVRLGLGVALALAFGATGMAFAVVVGGYVALEILRRARDKQDKRGGHLARRVARLPAAVRLAPKGAAAWSALAFASFGVLQKLDLLLANRLLAAPAAGAYAALSTLGGIGAFATATVPMVMLPRAAERKRHALAAALVIAGLIGAAAAIAGAGFPGLVLRLLYGARFADLAPLVGMYLLAMAFFGLVRVLVAHASVGPARHAATAVLVAGAAAQAALILTAARTPAAIATITLATMASVATAEGAVVLVASPRTRNAGRRALAALWQPVPLAVAAITILGTGVRFIITRGIWLDEATSIYEAKMAFPAMISQLYNHDVHPPLYFSILWADIRLFGTTQELIVRLPSIIFGAAIVPVAYLAGRDLYDRRTGVVAAMFASVGPLLVWYSQEARMYSMFMLFALVLVWAQAMVVKDGRRRYWALYTAAGILLGWTEYFGLLQLFTQEVVFLGVMGYRLRVSGRRRAGTGLRGPEAGGPEAGGPEAWSFVRAWLAWSAVLLVLLSPVVPFVLHQFLVNQSGGKGFNTPISQAGTAVSAIAGRFTVYTIIANGLWAIWGYQSDRMMAELGALWPLGLLLGLIALGRRHNHDTKLLLASIAGPFLLVSGLALLKPSLMDVRYLSGVVPLFTILIARMVTATTTRRLALGAVTSVVMVSLVAGLVDQQVNGSNPMRFDFHGALSGINARWRPGDRLVYAPLDIGQVVSYYSPEAAGQVLGATIPAPPPPGARLFVLESPILVAPGARARARSEIRAIARREPPVAVRKLANVTVWEFK
ncbi:MAG: glycosyltransferase family 39 protein [Acidimicrobiales bacterium]